MRPCVRARIRCQVTGPRNSTYRNDVDREDERRKEEEKEGPAADHRTASAATTARPGEPAHVVSRVIYFFIFND